MQKTMLHLAFAAAAALVFAGQARAGVPLDVPIFADAKSVTVSGLRLAGYSKAARVTVETLGGEPFGEVEADGACGLLFGERVCVFPMHENANENLEGKLK